MTAFDDDRRAFLARLLAAGGIALLGPRATHAMEAGGTPAAGTTPAPSSPPTLPARSTVWEIHFASLRDDSGRIHDLALQDFVMVAASALTGERFPLDGLAEIFP